jgi:hypothetical protein
MCRTDAGAGMVEPARLLFQIGRWRDTTGLCNRELAISLQAAYRAGRPRHGARLDQPVHLVIHAAYNAVHVAKLAAHQANGG